MAASEVRTVDQVDVVGEVDRGRLSRMSEPWQVDIAADVLASFAGQAERSRTDQTPRAYRTREQEERR